MLLALLLVFPAAPTDGGLHEAIQAILEYEGDEEARMRTLRRLGDDAIGPLWSLVVGSQAPGATPGNRGGQGVDIAFGALAMFEPRQLRSLMTDVLQNAPSLEARFACLRLLGEVGTAEDLALGLRAATPETGDLQPRLSRALSDAVVPILERDPRAYRALRERILGAHPEARFALVRALGAVRTTRSLELLGFLIGFDPELDVMLLAQISVVAPDVPQPISEDLCASVRERLADPSPRVVQAAARACGALGDAEAAESLVALLGHGERGVSSSAHWALTSLTGLGFPADERRWQSWFRSETEWFERDARRLYADLSASDPTQVARSINELSLHRMRRHEIAGQVAITLDDPRPEIRRLGCTALRQLGSGAVLPQLVAALEDGDEGVSSAAWSALKAITRRDLPADPEAWQAGLKRSS